MILLSSARTLLACAVRFGLMVSLCDIPQAYLQSDIGDRTVYLETPAGIRVRSNVIERIQREHPNERIGLQLLKSIYGLKNSGLQWHRLLREHLHSLGFRESHVESCLYEYKDDDGWVLLSTSVDDILITGTQTAKIKEFRTSS